MRDGPGPRQSPARAGRARAALAWGLVCFAALQLGTGAVVLFWWPQARERDYRHRLGLLRRWLARQPGRPLAVVAVGSSRTALGLRAASLTESLSRSEGRPVAVFNFSTPGAGTFVNLFHLRRLLDDGVRPDLVLLEVLPPLLADERLPEQAGAERLPVTALRWRELPLVARYRGTGRRRLRLDWCEALLAPWSSYRTQLLREAFPILLPYRERYARDFENMDEAGWMRPAWVSPAAGERHAALESARRQYAEGLRNFRLGARACGALREALGLCRSAGVPAALVLMPEGPAFRSWYPPPADARLGALAAALGREYGAAVVDARGWVGEGGFVDSHHLLPAAAASFTDRLGREAVAPLLRKHHPAGGRGKGGPS